MKRNAKKLLLAVISVICLTTIISCEKDYSSDDIDLIEGKWQDLSVLNNEEATLAQKMAYVEYAPCTSLRLTNRITYYTYIIDPSQEEDSIKEYISYGKYRLSGDSLVVRDNMDIQHYYTIVYIRNDSLIYTDKYNDTVRYIRKK